MRITPSSLSLVFSRTANRLFRRTASVVLMASLLFAIRSDDRVAEACGWSATTETVTRLHPDLPLQHFAAGRLGILRPTYTRSYLVVAYRHLQGIGMSNKEQRGAQELWNARLGMAQTPNAPEHPWLDAKQRILGMPQQPAISTSTTRHYAQIENCLPDAFEHAASVLEERVKQHGAKHIAVQSWVKRQDAVFANCGGSGQALPALAPNTPAWSKADAAYQQACAAFYAGDYGQAEQRFRAIANDASSPWRHLARYLVARAITRHAMLQGATPHQPSLVRAERELNSLLAEPRAQSMHGPARRYLQLVRFRTSPEALQGELAVRLARDRLDDDLRGALDDYTSLLDRRPDPMALTAPTSDRLSVWLGVVQSEDAKAFARALSLYNRTKTTVWLVAALMKATPSDGAKLDPLLQAAAAVPASHPGYVSARYHRLRLLLARNPADALFAEAKSVLASLSERDGTSAKNALLELAVRLAPSLDDMLAHVVTIPAGVEADGGPMIRPTDSAPPQIHPTAAGLLSSKLPLSELARAATSSRLPDNIRAQVAVAAWVRSVILNDDKIRTAIAPVVSSLNPQLRPYVQRCMAAKSRPKQRLALLEMMLEAPETSASVSAWRTGRIEGGSIDSSYAPNWWCGSAAAGGNAGDSWQSPGTRPPFDVRFLTTAQKQARDRQVRALEQLGSGPTFLANEAAKLAKLLPTDPRVPKLLHLAVRATRFGCKDAGTTPASRRAFRALHTKYPSSEWTKKTPYYY